MLGIIRIKGEKFKQNSCTCTTMFELLSFIVCNYLEFVGECNMPDSVDARYCI